jgi:hypothetical protein
MLTRDQIMKHAPSLDHLINDPAYEAAIRFILKEPNEVVAALLASLGETLPPAQRAWVIEHLLSLNPPH